MNKCTYYSILTILFMPIVSPLFLAPFGIFLFPDSFAKAIFFRVIVEVLLLFSLFHIFKKGFSFKPTTLVWLFSFLWLVMGISTLLSLEPHQSWFDLQYRSLGFFFYSHLFILLFILIYFIRGQKMWDRIFQVMIGIGGLVGLLGIMQRFGFYIKADYISVTSLTRPGGTLGNPNTFGAYLVILLPLTFLYFLKTKTTLWKRIFGGILLMELITLVMTGSRAATLGFVASAIIFAIFYPFQNKKMRRYVLSILVGVIFFTIIGVWLGFLDNLPVLNRFANIFQSTGTGSTRLTAWGSGLKSFLDRPLLGFGLENFAMAFDRNYNPFFGIYAGLEEHWWGRAHNFYVEWLVGMGILGFAAYTAAYTYLFSALRKIKSKSSTAIMATLAGYLVYGLFNFDVPANLVLIFILFGYSYYLINADKYTDRFKKITIPGKNIIIGILSILTILVIWNLNLKPFFINAEANRIEAEFFDKPEESFNRYLKILEKPTYIDHDLNLRFYATSVKYLNWLMGQGKNEEAIIKRKLLIEKLEDNLTIKPHYTRNSLFLGDSYTQLITLEKENKIENFTKAKEHYEEAVRLSPTREEGRIGLAHLARITNNHDEAIRILKSITDLNNAYGPAHYWLSINLFYKNEIDKGIEEMKIAIKSGYELPKKNLEIIFKNQPDILEGILKELQ